jgi:hypothetical protein
MPSRFDPDHGRNARRRRGLLLPTEPAPDQLEVKQRLWALMGLPSTSNTRAYR